MLIDNTLSRIEEIKGPSRNFEREDISPVVHKKKAKKKVKGTKGEESPVKIEKPI